MKESYPLKSRQRFDPTYPALASRRRGTQCLLADALELGEVMAAVDEVEATPLIGGERSEDEVRGERAGVEAFVAFLDLGIHGFEL